VSGTVRPRDGRWEYRLDAGRDPITGHRTRPGRSGFPTRAAAEKALRQAETAQAGHGSTSMTLLAYLTNWLTDVRASLSPSTWRTYNLLVASSIAPAIGTIQLNEFSAAHLNQFYAHLLTEGRTRSKGGLSPKSVNNIHRMLHRALTPAVDAGLVDRSVLDDAQPPHVPDRDPIRWNSEQRAHFELQLRGDRLQALGFLLITSSLHPGELVALRREDVDLACQRIAIGRDVYVLEPIAAEALQHYVGMWQDERNLLGQPESILFTRPDGTSLKAAWVMTWFHQQCDRARLPHIRLAELRAGYADQTQKAGRDPGIDQDQSAADTVAALILGHEGGREMDAASFTDDSTGNEEPPDHSRFRRSEGTSTCSGGRI